MNKINIFFKEYTKVFKILNKTEKTKTFFLLLLMLFNSTLEAVGVGILFPYLTIIENPQKLFEYNYIHNFLNYFSINTNFRIIFFASIIVIIVYLIKCFIGLFINFTKYRFTINLMIKYGEKLFRNYLEKNYLYHVNTNSTYTIRNVNLIRNVFELILINALTLLSNLFICISIIVMIFIVDWSSSLMIFLLLSFIGIIIFSISKITLLQCGIKTTDYLAKCYKDINQGLGGIKEVKIARKEGFFVSQYKSDFTKFAKYQKRACFFTDLPKYVLESSTILILVLMVLIKMINNISVENIISTMGMLAFAAIRLLPSFVGIINASNNVNLYKAWLEPIYEDLISIKSREETLPENPVTKQLTFNNTIEIKNLCFSYIENKYVLKNINISIKKGEFVGITGESGAGKTTFVDLLLGLLKPTEGGIFIDDCNINDNLDSWLSHIAYVPQSVYLLDGTVKENIALGIKEEEINIDLLESSMKKAEIYDLVQSLPNKENTIVGENGSKLSGGQKQRIGIARALYTCPDILFLDEATSALDNDTEKAIMETILKLKGSITILSIAHRLSTLEKCNYILHFENGSCVKEEK